MIDRLEASIKAVCPVVSTRQLADGSFDFIPAESATKEQIAAGNAIVTTFDKSDAAQSAWEDDQRPERKTLRAAVAQAVADNATYLAIATPTAAQVAAQVRRLTQQSTAMIKRLAQLD